VPELRFEELDPLPLIKVEEIIQMSPLPHLEE
jgi:hypothetical protein